MRFLKVYAASIVLQLTIQGTLAAVWVGHAASPAPSLHGGVFAHGDTVRIEPRSSWKAAPARPFKRHTPVQITVHHEGGKILTTSDDARQRLKNIQHWCMGPDRNWADIPYHLLIAPDGTVYQGRDPLTVGETNTEYDPAGHLLICFLGNYNEQKLNDKLLKVLIGLLADSCVKYGISPEEISTHRDHSQQTACPGEDIYSYFKNGYIVEQVKDLLEATGAR